MDDRLERFIAAVERIAERQGKTPDQVMQEISDYLDTLPEPERVTQPGDAEIADEKDGPD